MSSSLNNLIENQDQEVYNAPLCLMELKMTTDQEFNRLFWHCRRGMLELDVLLVPFLQEAYKELPEEDQERFKKLLQNEDTDIFHWFMKKSEPEDPDLKRIVSIILDRVQPK